MTSCFYYSIILGQYDILISFSKVINEWGKVHVRVGVAFINRTVLVTLDADCAICVKYRWPKSFICVGDQGSRDWTGVFVMCTS